MTKEALLQLILESDKREYKFYLAHWLEASSRFLAFIENHKEKVRSKLAKAKSADAKKDVLFELNVAYLLLSNDGLEIEYEKYGAGEERAPDYCVTIGREAFNVEVTRVHEKSISNQYNDCINSIAKEVIIIPSELSFSINWVTCSPDEWLVSILEESKDLVINFVKEKIKNDAKDIAPGEGKEYVIPISDFRRNLHLHLSKPFSKNDTTKTSHNPGSRPIFYTRKEYKKIGDIIFDKLGQMIPNMINILLISADNTTFENEDLPETIASINQLISKNDNQFFIGKKFQGTEDFLNQAKKLSAILFRSGFISRESRNRNYLWQNSNAEKQLPNSIAQLLENLN